MERLFERLVVWHDRWCSPRLVLVAQVMFYSLMAAAVAAACW